jgi:hypothetical protein
MLKPIPEHHRERIHDHLLGMRFWPGEPYTLDQMARAVDCWWPGVTAAQIKATLAGLASKEKRIREAMREGRGALRAESG